jgi:hypothetical protein
MSFRNEGNIDRGIRVALGVLLLVAGWGGIVEGTPGTVFQWLGFVPLATGLIGWCPLYAIFGVSTRPAGSVAERQEVAVTG